MKPALEWTLEKRVFYPTYTEKTGPLLRQITSKNQDELVKTASVQLYPLEIQDYIKNAKPLPGKTQVLINAMGASDWYGPNSNGDYFLEKTLSHKGDDYGYKTFETDAFPYRHHLNYGEPFAYGGRPKVAAYDKGMHRVHLVVIIDNNKCPDLIESINGGGFPEVSMGCRLPWDECSICGHHAKVVEDHCEHCKLPILGDIMPDGRVACMINVYPRFHDISFVIRGAERASSVMRKIAMDLTKTANGTFFSLPSYLYPQLLKTAIIEDKTAEIQKEIPLETEDVEQVTSPNGAVITIVDAAADVKDREPAIPSDVLERIASLCPTLGSILQSFTSLGMYPKPEEFQKIVLMLSGKKPLADSLEQQGIVFDEQDGQAALAQDPSLEEQITGCEKVSSEAVALLQPYFEDRSCFPVQLCERVTKLATLFPSKDGYQTSETKSPVVTGASVLPALGILAGLYLLGKHRMLPSFFSKLVGADVGTLSPFAIPMLAAAGIAAAQVGGRMSVADFPVRVANRWSPEMTRMYFEREGFEKGASLADSFKWGALAVAPMYLYAGHQKLKEMQGEPIGPVDQLVTQYPMMATLLAALMGPKLVKGLKARTGFTKTSSDQEINNFLHKVFSSARFSFAKRGGEGFSKFAASDYGKVYFNLKTIEAIINLIR